MSSRIVLAAALAFFASTAARGDEPAKELAKLQGSWKVKNMELAGAPPVPEEAKAKIRIIVKDDKMRFEGPLAAEPNGAKPEFPEFQVSFDPKAAKAVDLLAMNGPRKGQKALGLYSIEGDVLKLAIPNKPDSPRPTEVAATPGTLVMLMTLERVKAEK